MAWAVGCAVALVGLVVASRSERAKDAGCALVIAAVFVLLAALAGATGIIPVDSFVNQPSH